MTNFFQNKKVLVAGASGFVGTHLFKRLNKLGAKVLGTYNRKPSKNLPFSSQIQCDFTKYDDCLKATNNIDYVFMCAAKTSGAAVMEKTPLAHLTPNVIMNAQILAAAYQNNVSKFCFISSNTVYPVTDLAVKENDVNYEFFSKYFIVGWMKLFSEKMTEMYSNHIKSPMNTLVVRPGNLYGPNDKFTWKESKVIAALIRKCIEGHNPLQVWGDGQDLKDFLYIDDFITGLLLAFQNINEFEAINIASSIPITIKEILNIILELEDSIDTEIKFDTSLPTMLPKRLINTERIREIENWEPKIPIREGLKKTIEWYKEYYKKQSPEEKYDN